MGTLQLADILLWGAFATGILTLVMAASQGLGWTRISFPFMLGSLFTSNRDAALVLGFCLHFCLGWLFALLYGLTFESWGISRWWTGALLGTYHGLFMLVVGVRLLDSIHPRMADRHQGPTPTRQLEPPGFMALNYGRNTPLITLLAHVIYGLILGSFYQPG